MSRNQIALESTIGEGEFGRVVKAKVSNLHDAIGTTVVAIKMLKGESIYQINSSSSFSLFLS